MMQQYHLMLIPVHSEEVKDIQLYDNADSMLVELGIIDESVSFDEGITFTRGELAQRLVKLMNAEDYSWGKTVKL